MFRDVFGLSEGVGGLRLFSVLRRWWEGVGRASTWGTTGNDFLFDALMCFWSGCLLNRASTWGMAGFDLQFAAMPLM